jgi:hypothetical protein
MRKTVSPTSPARAATPVRRSIPAQKSKKGAGERKLSRIDTILIVAIAAAVLALVAMVFGLTTAGEMPFMQQR